MCTLCLGVRFISNCVANDGKRTFVGTIVLLMYYRELIRVCVVPICFDFSGKKINEWYYLLILIACVVAARRFKMPTSFIISNYMSEITNLHWASVWMMIDSFMNMLLKNCNKFSSILIVSVLDSSCNLRNQINKKYKSNVYINTLHLSTKKFINKQLLTDPRNCLTSFVTSSSDRKDP